MFKKRYSFTIYEGEADTLVTILDTCRELSKYLGITLNCAQSLANKLLTREYIILKKSKQKISLLDNKY